MVVNLVFCLSGENGFGGSLGGLSPGPDVGTDLSIAGDGAASSGGNGGIAGGSRSTCTAFPG